MPSPARTLYAASGLTLDASDVSEVLTIGRAAKLWLVVFVKGSVDGTNPTLNVAYEQIDANGNYISIGQITQLDDDPEISYGTLSLGGAGSEILLTPSGRLRWVIGGTDDPSFNNVDISLQSR